MSEASPNLVYVCEPWEIDLGQRELRAGGLPVPLGGRAFKIVEVLVQSANQLVPRGQLTRHVWPGAIVGENTLHVHISAVRKALGRDRGLLKTTSGRGFCLVGEWTPRRGGAAAPLVSQPTRASKAPSTDNLPASVSRLIGRSEAVQAVRDLASAYRVVTLTGPGGIGKTALALEAARGMRKDFTGGAWFVELASVSDPALVPSAVAHALELRLRFASKSPLKSVRRC